MNFPAIFDQHAAHLAILFTRAPNKKTKNGGPIWENPVGDVVEEVEKMKAHTP